MHANGVRPDVFVITLPTFKAELARLGGKWGLAAGTVTDEQPPPIGFTHFVIETTIVCPAGFIGRNLCLTMRAINNERSH
ncbi:hypothetical protein [Bradyrhizobium sp. 30]|uniref:hypothetical protein n=1 Tax=Bradyrhizobium sp. 30 TaxID=2782669 RepID=UPI001FF70784|nr:hypothetical protein [Bradyrhizobium sp. 30]MCK1293998.1 hypothetical protein [Bradyrhizobium sp. 30]